MSRWWNETVAPLVDAVGPVGLTLILLALAALIGAGWHWFPAWIPTSLPRLRRRNRDGVRRPWWRRLRWRRRPRKQRPDEPVTIDGDGLPDLPVEAFVTLADALAAQGRYAEAVRERLRAIVRDLVDAGVITHHPEWTVTELARAAVRARPAIAVPLSEATVVFSDIWYGEHPAQPSHDARMREYADAVGTSLHRTPASTGQPS